MKLMKGSIALRFCHITDIQLPTTNYQLPTTNYQLPTTNNQLPTTNYQLPTTNYKLPTMEILQYYTTNYGNTSVLHYQLPIRFTVINQGYTWTVAAVLKTAVLLSQDYSKCNYDVTYSFLLGLGLSSTSGLSSAPSAVGVVCSWSSSLSSLPFSCGWKRHNFQSV